MIDGSPICCTLTVEIMQPIFIANDDALVTATNYWDSELAQSGEFFLSLNAGVLRVLVPPSHCRDVEDMTVARECILSRGPWPALGLVDASEIMWEDDSRSPYAIQLSPGSCDSLPAEPEKGREWRCAVWIAQDGKPHCVVEHTCRWRKVPYLPWLKAWR